MLVAPLWKANQYTPRKKTWDRGYGIGCASKSFVADAASVRSDLHRNANYCLNKAACRSWLHDLLFVPDFSGLLHCLDAKTGKPYWVYDLLAACWGSPIVVDDRVYISDEDGDVAVFKVSSKMELLNETNLGAVVFTTPVVANDTLFLSSSHRLWALEEGAKSEASHDK